MHPARIRGTYKKAWSRIAREPLSERAIKFVGEALVRHFANEARRDFALRKWSVRDPMGGPPVHKSFSYRVRGSQVEVLSTYYGMEELLQGVPARPLTWLTQEGDERNPRRPQDRARLVVPLRGPNKTVIFRSAPERMADAWIHPGIKKFAFGDRAVRYARREIDQILTEDVAQRLSQGDPTR